jgi:ribosome assembly protein YihI (activator of Der GTPase)
MADPNLTAALRGALDLLDGDSPLSEADPKAVDELLDRINQNLVAGLPGRITDKDLTSFVNMVRAQAYRWTQEDQNKTPKVRERKTHSQAVDIEL